MLEEGDTYSRGGGLFTVNEAHQEAIDRMIAGKNGQKMDWKADRYVSIVLLSVRNSQSALWSAHRARNASEPPKSM